MQALSSGQRAYLRRAAHDLSPIVQVGKAGLTPGLMGAVGDALDAHELIKVKLLDAGEERQALGEQLANETGSALVTIIGNVVTLYREHPERERRQIVLPA